MLGIRLPPGVPKLAKSSVLSIKLGLMLDNGLLPAAMLLACRIADAEAYRQCEIKQRALADWIRAGE